MSAEQRASLRKRLFWYLTTMLLALVGGIVITIRRDSLIVVGVKAYDAIAPGNRQASTLFLTVAVAFVATFVKRTNLLVYGLVEILAGVFISSVAWDRLATDPSFTATAVVLGTLYFIIRAMDNIASGFTQYFTRLDDITHLVFADIEDDPTTLSK